MRALAPAILVLSIAAIALASPAHAMRIALYRVGGAVVTPGTLEDPGTYELGPGFNVGVTVPFMHRIAATIDVSHERLNWENGSEIRPANERFVRKDLAITSFMLGADVAFRRGNAARPLLTFGLGVAQVSPGDAEITDVFSSARTTQEGETETVFAMSANAGVRIRALWWPATRMTIGVMGLARDEFAYVVPLRVQVEF